MQSRLNLSIIFTLLIWIFLSWLLVHVFALFGVFIALAYPILWLLYPQKTTCFTCQVKKDGDYCGFCQKPVNKFGGIYPSNVRSIVLNSLLVLCFSFFSLALVLVESRLLQKLGFTYTAKTASFVIPPRSQYRLGQIFPLKIDIQNVNNSINVVQADLSFDPNILEVVSISTEDSFANVFVQKEVNNEGGWARLSGGVPNPGFAGERGLFGTVYFMAKTPGLTRVEYMSSSMVLANDGKGSNILQAFPSVSYLILPERLSREETELQRQLFFPTDEELTMGPVEGQLAFYEEPNLGVVLGATSEEEGDGSWWRQLMSWLLTFLHRIDVLIIGFWQDLLL